MIPHLYNRRVILSGTDYKLCEEFFNTAYRRFNTTNRTPLSTSSAVYNIEFTPSNSNTVIACHADKTLSLYDVRLESKTCSVPKAHDDGINIISFLDYFLFATGSDDEKIKIWDLRMLSNKSVAVLRGHQGWVKNVEIDRRSNSIISVAFNDGVRKWDMDRLDMYESGTIDNLLFDIPQAIRVRLSPNNSTLVVCLRKDHIIVINNFDGNTIEEIKDGFPKEFPLDENKQKKFIENFQYCTKNIPSVHEINSMVGNSYRTPLSLACHPDSKHIAMRMVDVHRNMLDHELTVLYKIDQSNCVAYNNIDNTSCNFIRYVDEESPDSVLDYIKEISFSHPDGRILVSPYINGVRLLAVDQNCTPMDLFYDRRYSSFEKRMKCIDFDKIGVCSDSHKDGVLTCRLCSDNMCLVSGSVDGDLVFNWPRL